MDTLTLLKAAVDAKLAAWDATDALEKHLVPPDGDVSDEQADFLTHWIESGALVGGVDDSSNIAEFEAEFGALA
jgi:hypothetical protein